MQRSFGSKRRHAVKSDESGVGCHHLGRHPLKRLQGRCAIATRSLHLRALTGLQRRERPVLQVAARGEDDNPSFIDDQQVAGQLSPTAFGFFNVQLDRDHASRGLAAAQCVGKVLAGLAAGDADAVEAATSPQHGFDYIGPEREILTDGRARLIPIGCR